MNESVEEIRPESESTPRTMPGWVPALVAGAVAALLRLLYVLDMRSSVAFDQPIMDEFVHDARARGTLRLFFEDIPYFRAPLYPWFLEFLYLFHDGYLWPRIVQALLGALTVALVADTGRRLAGPVAGLAGGLLLALCWPVIYFAGELLIVTFFTTLVVLSLWMFVRAGLEDRRSWALAGAVVLGVASIARPTALVFLPALVLLALWAWPRMELARLGRWRWRGAALLVLVALLPGLALSVRNQVVGDDWVFIASQGGVNFYIGNNPESDGRTAVVPGTSGTWLGGYRDTIERAQRETGRELRPSEVSDYYYREGLRFWIEEPGRALRLTAHKLRLLVGAAERSNNKNLHYWRAQSPVLSLPVYTSWASLFAFGLIGIWLCRRRVEATPLWAFLILYAVGLVAFFLNERFRIPLVVVLAVFSGITVAHLVAAFRARRFRQGALVAAGVAVLFAGSWSDRLDFKGDRIEADAFSRYTVGNLHMAKGDYRAAASSYQESLEIAREYRLAHFDEVELMLRRALVRALFRLHHFEAADQHLQVLEAQAPDDLQTLVLRGRYHLWHHDPDAAFPYYRRAVDMAPDHPEALLGLAWCQMDNQAWVAAGKNVDRVIARYGPSAEALAAKGKVVLYGERNPRHAKRLFEQALELDWNTPAAHQYLGVIFHQDNDRARAAYHYREAARLDPENLRVTRFLRRSRLDFEHPEGTQRPEY